MNNSFESIARRLFKLIRDPENAGGFTFYVSPEPEGPLSPAKGFVVAPDKATEWKGDLHDLTEDAFVRWLSSHRHLISLPGACVGGWVDGDGVFTLDISFPVGPRRAAELVAFWGYQDALWDIENGLEIRIRRRLFEVPVSDPFQGLGAAGFASHHSIR